MSNKNSNYLDIMRPFDGGAYVVRPVEGHALVWSRLPRTNFVALQLPHLCQNLCSSWECRSVVRTWIFDTAVLVEKSGQVERKKGLRRPVTAFSKAGDEFWPHACRWERFGGIMSNASMGKEGNVLYRLDRQAQDQLCSQQTETATR